MAARVQVSSLTRLAASRLPAITPRPSSSFCAQTRKIAAQGVVCRRAFSGAAIRHVKKYSEEHEWIELDTDGTTGTIGVSTYAANALGDVVYVELPAVDADVSKGDTIGAVESVKSASDILSPISGKVLETNADLEKKPSLINKSPEHDAWIAKIKVSDTTELDSLMDAEAYAKFTEE